MWKMDSSQETVKGPGETTRGGKISSLYRFVSPPQGPSLMPVLLFRGGGQIHREWAFVNNGRSNSTAVGSKNNTNDGDMVGFMDPAVDRFVCETERERERERGAMPPCASVCVCVFAGGVMCLLIDRSGRMNHVGRHDICDVMAACSQDSTSVLFGSKAANGGEILSSWLWWLWWWLSSLLSWLAETKKEKEKKKAKEGTRQDKRRRQRRPIGGVIHSNRIIKKSKSNDSNSSLYAIPNNDNDQQTHTHTLQEQ